MDYSIHSESLSAMKSIAVIRAQAADHDTDRLMAELRPAFGEDVYILSESYADPGFEMRRLSERHLELGGGFLARHGLPGFPRVGWQCGDFIYYGALDYLPPFDRLWMVEADVSLRFDVKTRLAALDANGADLLIPQFRKRGSAWGWTKSIADQVPEGQVYGGLFPITRISTPALRHLLQQRAAYARQARFQGMGAPDKAPHLFANDEAFTCTILQRDGFQCQDLFACLDVNTTRDFSLRFPIHPDELPLIADSIVHPVCVGEKAETKLAHVFTHMEDSLPKLRARQEAFCARLGQERWQEFSGLPAQVLNGHDFEVTPDTALPLLLRLLREVEHARDAGHFAGASLKVWVFQKRVGVIEIRIGAARFGLDVKPVFTPEGQFGGLNLVCKLRNPEAEALFAIKRDGQTRLRKIGATSKLARMAMQLGASLAALLDELRSKPAPKPKTPQSFLRGVLSNR